jgi:hypothetical protein
MSQLAASAHGYLDRQLDWDNRGVERDLHEISKVLVDWKVKLCDHMQLKRHEVYRAVASTPAAPARAGPVFALN